MKTMTDFQKQQLWDLWEEMQDQEELMEANYIFQHTNSIRQKLREVRNEIEKVIYENERNQSPSIWDFVDRIVNERREAR